MLLVRKELPLNTSMEKVFSLKYALKLWLDDRNTAWCFSIWYANPEVLALGLWVYSWNSEGLLTHWNCMKKKSACGYIHEVFWRGFLGIYLILKFSSYSKIVKNDHSLRALCLFFSLVVVFISVLPTEELVIVGKYFQILN